NELEKVKNDAKNEIEKTKSDSFVDGYNKGRERGRQEEKEMMQPIRPLHQSTQVNEVPQPQPISHHLNTQVDEQQQHRISHQSTPAAMASEPPLRTTSDTGQPVPALHAANQP